MIEFLSFTGRILGLISILLLSGCVKDEQTPVLLVKVTSPLSTIPSLEEVQEIIQRDLGVSLVFIHENGKVSGEVPYLLGRFENSKYVDEKYFINIYIDSIKGGAARMDCSRIAVSDPRVITICHEIGHTLGLLHNNSCVIMSTCHKSDVWPIFTEEEKLNIKLNCNEVFWNNDILCTSSTISH